MKIIFLFPYPHGQSPSQRFRFEQYAGALRKSGIEFTYQSFWDQDTWNILYDENHGWEKLWGFVSGISKRINMIFSIRQFDFVFIHRECAPLGPPIFEWIIAKIIRKKIIYDFDDSIWLPNTSKENQIVRFIKWHRKVKTICKWSYKVSCGNSHLAEYASRFNTAVIINPTTIDTDYHHNPELYSVDLKKNITIGWTGTHSTMSYLETLSPIFQKLTGKFGDQIKYLVISNKAPKIKIKQLEYIPWSKENEIADLLLLDIGLMPLTDDAWTQGKCGFKALQYMALEIPTVASPVGVNRDIIEHSKSGFLCTQEEDWLNSIERLILDSGLRKAMGRAGRQKVIAAYSTRSNSSTFLGLFS